MDKHYNEKMQLEAMKWYGWGSPIGLSAFFVALALSFALIWRVITG